MGIYVVLFGCGVGLGIIISFIGLVFLIREVNLVSGLWILCIVLGILGMLSSLGGVYIEIFHGLDLGLWLIVFGAMLMGTFGVAATLYMLFCFLSA